MADEPVRDEALRIWVDTDVGRNPDDAVALLAAIAHPKVQLVGVSTVDGDVHERARVARGLVGPVPVVAGTGGLVDAVAVARPDALLAIGPLTNVASMLGAGVLPVRVVVMGGVIGGVRHRGAWRRVEHNFGADPDAAARVVEASAAMIVPLDVTVAMRLTPEERHRLFAADGRLDGPIRSWEEAQRAAGVPEDDVAVVLHDPLALLVLAGDADADAGNMTEAMHLVVDRDGTLREDRAGARHDVVRRVDGPGARRRVLDLLRVG